MTAILTIDTSTRWAGVGVFGAGEPVEVTWHSNQNHGAELMNEILAALDQRHLALDDVGVIAVAIGPGGFSALRVGLATAKGIVAAGGQSLVGISTFDIEAAAHWPPSVPLAALVDAGSAGIAWALYDGGDDPARPVSMSHSGLSPVAELVEMAPADTLFCGEPALGLGELVDESRILSRELPTRRPAHLASLARRRVEAGELDDPAALEPDYARPPSITSPNR